jgi:hypothetical protein
MWKPQPLTALMASMAYVGIALPYLLFYLKNINYYASFPCKIEHVKLPPHAYMRPHTISLHLRKTGPPHNSLLKHIKSCHTILLVIMDAAPVTIQLYVMVL